MDKNEFFREVTLRICGTLEIEEALHSCVEYLSQYIPTDKMYLERFDRGIGSFHLVARADREKGEPMDQLIPLDKEAIEALKKAGDTWRAGELPPVFVINRPEEEPITRCLLKALDEPMCSAMSLPLVVGDQVLGTLALLAEGNDRFTDEHSQLYAMLKDPFIIAMSNTLKHRNELRLFDRDFFFEVTKRICGTLEIEKGLQECLFYLSEYIPADYIHLEKYEENFSSMLHVARATFEKAEKLNSLIHLPKGVQEAEEKFLSDLQEGKLPPVVFFNDPGKEPILARLTKSLGHSDLSVMALPLLLEDQLAGVLVLHAKGKNRFTEDHAELFSLLKHPFFVAMSNYLKHQEIINLKDMLADDNRYLQGELRRLSGDKIVGADFGLRDVMHKVQQVAALDSPVLLLGETGVGKDVIANTIHYSSLRSSGPFINVNCGAIPDTLIDSELFGHEKGAFTGALSQKRGRFERADKGTIFLDEIGELPLPAQVRLLKVLQSKEIERVGGTKTIRLDLRIIAATNRDLEEMVTLLQFREDLFYRLNVFPIWIPPLRERKADIPALVQHFITLKAKELKLSAIPSLASGAIEPMMEYHWPGNVRELENVIERALILNPKGPLSFEHPNQGQLKVPLKLKAQSEKTDNLDEIITRHIRQVLSKTKGKVHGQDGAAVLLGINSSTLRNRMKKLGIDYGRKK